MTRFFPSPGWPRVPRARTALIVAGRRRRRRDRRALRGGGGRAREDRDRL